MLPEEPALPIMGKAIAFVSLIVLCSFGFVLFQLLRHVPRGASAPAGPAPMLVNREDGTVYDVSLQLSRFERRLMEEEKRSQQLRDELDALRTERDTLNGQVEELQGEVRRLRRQVSETPAARPQQQAPAGPAPVPGNGPVTPAPLPGEPVGPSPGG